MIVRVFVRLVSSLLLSARFLAHPFPFLRPTQDLRTSRSTPHTIHTLTSNSYINSLAICPTNTHQIVLGLDNGSLGWIDWRKGNRMANRKFSAHADAVMSVDWKESMDERGEGRAAGGWIASGGLDKKVHVSIASLFLSELFSTLTNDNCSLLLFF